MRTEVRRDRTAASAVRGSIGGLDHLGWLAGDAMLVASELVTNVVTHMGCDPEHRIELEVTEGRDAVCSERMTTFRTLPSGSTLADRRASLATLHQDSLSS
jgi:hypothetical protein